MDVLFCKVFLFRCVSFLEMKVMMILLKVLLLKCEIL